MINSILHKLSTKEALTKRDVETLFTDLVSDAERKEFLLLLNERGVTAEDIALFVEVLLPKKFPEMPEAIDVCGTGGSGLKRINTSTIASFVLASAGIGIAKHGNRASSGRFGSFDLLEKLGVNIDFDEKKLKEAYKKTGLAFIFAQKFFPAMRYFAQVRKDISAPTVFNFLGPLLNPAQPKKQVIGTCSKDNAVLLAKASKLLGKEHVVVVSGLDRLDEITISNMTYCCEMKDGEINEFMISPDDLGFERVLFKKIAGGTPVANTYVAMQILNGTCETAHVNLVLANVAFILFFMGKVDTPREGVMMAEEIIKKGLALEKYNAYKAL